MYHLTEIYMTAKPSKPQAFKEAAGYKTSFKTLVLLYYFLFRASPPAWPPEFTEWKKSNWLLVSELLFLVNLYGFFSVMRGSSEGKKVVMTGERSQLSQWKPASHLCWPCAAEFPRRRQSRYALQQGGGVRMTRMAAEKQDLIVFGNKISPGVVVAKVSQQCCGGLISQKWHEFMENDSSVSSAQFMFFLIATLTKRSRHSIWP